MYLLAGLGNPGRQYEKTQHNVGFMVVDELKKKKMKGVRFLKPDTFMNNSGVAVKSALSKYQIPNTKYLIVIHDDIDIPLGKVKVSFGRGSAGHKGVESIIKTLGTKEFTRIRIGIQPSRGKPKNVEDFVLKKFTQAESKILQNVMADLTPRIEALILPLDG